MELFGALILFGAVLPVHSGLHSLYYIYTALSKPVDLPGIYEFSAMGLLDDRQIDYFNSENQTKIPKQKWMKEKMMEEYWEKGTQSRKRKQQWFNVNINILMERMKHNNTDLHIFQWRHGCEIDKQTDGSVKYLKGVSEYGYDGQNFLSFDTENLVWIASVDEAFPTKRKWDNVPILNQYTKGYLEKECVDWLKAFLEYADEESKDYPPEVFVFEKKTLNDQNEQKSQMKLTCFGTGFYPQDVTLSIRKNNIMLSEADIESSGVRPNHDGTYQMRKTVEIKEDEKADYDCYMTHRALKEPVISKWD